MPFVVDSTFKLPPSVTIDNTEDLAQSLLALNPGADGIKLDCANTQIITTPGAQLLLALDHLLAQGGSKLSIMNATENFKGALHTLGMDEHFKKWSNP